MIRPPIWWWWVLAVTLVPTLLLLPAGWLWLAERDLLLYWLVGSTLAALVVGALLSRWGRHGPRPSALEVAPSPRWTAAGTRAWQGVDELARRVEADDKLPLTPVAAQGLLGEILGTVARAYHPRSSHPELEVPLTHALRIVELVTRDLKTDLATQVPGAHVFTLNDLRRLHRWSELWRRWYEPSRMLYRLASLGWNPLGALLGHVRDQATGQMADVTASEVRKWALGYAVRKAGYYAIELYSGQLVLDESEFAKFVGAGSERDAAQAQAREAALATEPLRVLVIGQAKAGKSSLVNAMFGAVRAAVDIVPRTAQVEPYVLERDGLPRAIILDTAGYATGDQPPGSAPQGAGEWLRVDVVVVVCSALSAARAADRAVLEQLRAEYREHPERVLPPVVAVVTHVDQLRPLAEWLPPYDLYDAERPKARQIAAAVEAVAGDLGLPTTVVVPVCLAVGREDNVNETLIPLLVELLPAADRVKYLRCLREYHDREYWRLLGTQALNAGRLLWRAGEQVLGAKLGVPASAEPVPGERAS